MQKSYLPSKEFIIRIAIIVSIIVIVFGVSKIFQYFKNKPRNEATVKVLVKDVVGKDSNNNGIADWEEYLWGLNPEKNGPENKQFILAKKKTLLDNTGIDITNQSEITENEQMSREFFAIVMSLMQSGNLTEESINQISEKIGKKIEAKPIDDLYKKEMLKIVAGNSVDGSYIKSFEKLVDKYEYYDMGSELNIIAQAISQNDKQALYVVNNIALYYRQFSKELMLIPTPERIYPGHLSLANDYEKIAQSIEDLSKIMDDPLVGMRGLLNYNKYNEAVLLDIQNISDNL